MTTRQLAQQAIPPMWVTWVSQNGVYRHQDFATAFLLPTNRSRMGDIINIDVISQRRLAMTRLYCRHAQPGMVAKQLVRTTYPRCWMRIQQPGALPPVTWAMPSRAWRRLSVVREYRGCLYLARFYHDDGTALRSVSGQGLRLSRGWCSLIYL
jgi:hypothetical protein